MNRDPNPHRNIWRALAVAPLAGPLAIWACLVLIAVVMPRAATDSVNSVVSVILLAFVLLSFGAPLGYSATFVAVLPAFRLLDAAGKASWWAITLVGGVVGAISFPLYLHILAPRGSFGFFPGAGFVAGAASGLAFWWVATR